MSIFALLHNVCCQQRSSNLQFVATWAAALDENHLQKRNFSCSHISLWQHTWAAATTTKRKPFKSDAFFNFNYRTRKPPKSCSKLNSLSLSLSPWKLSQTRANIATKSNNISSIATWWMGDIVARQLLTVINNDVTQASRRVVDEGGKQASWSQHVCWFNSSIMYVCPNSREFCLIRCWVGNWLSRLSAPERGTILRSSLVPAEEIFLTFTMIIPELQLYWKRYSLDSFWSSLFAASTGAKVILLFSSSAHEKKAIWREANCEHTSAMCLLDIIQVFEAT